MKEYSLQRVIRKSGRKPIACKCAQCKEQCRTPCLGTPEDILRLIKAGYGDKLKPTLWYVGVLVGHLKYPIPMIQAIQTAEDWCIFRDADGLCSIHDLGLKPAEGKLSHHSIAPENYVFVKSLSYNVAKEWLREENNELITEIIKFYE